MSQAILYEAYGESKKGKILVAQVIYNRAKTWGMTFCEVVNEKRGRRYQFSYHHKLKYRMWFNKRTYKEADVISRGVIIKGITTSVLFFKRCDIENKGFEGLIFKLEVGNHCFYGRV